MRLVWLILFLVLLLCQVFALLAGRLPLRQGQPVAAFESHELAAVATGTRDAWIEVLEQGAAGETPDSSLEGGALLERGQLLLELRDAESELADASGEVRLWRELESWIAASGGQSREGSEGSAHVEFISGLIGWLQPFRDAKAGVVLERSFLNPESASSFPCLVFELNGSPTELGALLLDYEDRFRGWRLRELDLNRSKDGPGWWVRGSYAFGGGGP